MHFAESKKPIRKGYVLYDSYYMTLWKRQIRETVKGSVVARDWKWEEAAGRNRWSTRDFHSSEMTLYGTVLADPCRYTFVKTHRQCNTEEALM